MNAPNPMIAPAAVGGAPAAGFPTGQGQEYSHATHRQSGEPNPASHAGQPYPTITGREIAAMVETPPRRVDKSRGQWFIPSTYAAHDARSHEAQRARGSFNWLTLDVDENDLPLGDVLDALRGTLGACRFLAYSTPSATAQRRKWRVLVPLAAPLAGADFTDTQEAFFSLLIEHSQGALIPDPALKRPAQLIYLPNPQGDFYEREICRDAPVLALTDSHAVMLRREENRAKRAEAEREAKSRRERRAAERAALAFGEGDRPGDIFNTRHSVADLLARYGYVQCRGSNDWRSPMQTSKSFATRDMGEYWISLSASDAAAGIGSQTKSGCRFGDAFDLFVHFGHGGDMSKAAKAYWAELQPFGGWPTLSSDFPAPMPRTEPPDDLAQDFPPPSTAPNAGPVRRAKWCADLACSTLETDPAWRSVLAFDELAQLTMLLQPIPGTTVPKASFKPRPICDTDFTAAVRWFNRNGYPDATRNTVTEAVYLVAGQTVISPVRHYLESLQWDGTPRAADWLTRYCGAAPSDLTGKVGKAWLISAVARALSPGCKADCALVLEGPQGAGKSSVLRALAGEAWFHDGLSDLHGKDASAALRGKWIIELPELAAMRRSDNEAVKAFLSRTEERYRPPYGRAEVVEPRRCVFAGTTNRADYLNDDTGGRRFWPITVGQINLPDLKRDRDQLWSEAVALYRAGAPWWLDAEAEIEAAAVVSTRAADDPWTADVLAAVASMAECSTRDVFQLLDIDRERWGKPEGMRIAGILTRAGWTRAGKFSGGPNRNLSRYVAPGGNHA